MMYKMRNADEDQVLDCMMVGKTFHKAMRNFDWTRLNIENLDVPEFYAEVTRAKDNKPLFVLPLTSNKGKDIEFMLEVEPVDLKSAINPN